MNNIFVRILIITLAVIGVYKMFPQISRPVDYYLKQPKFQSGVLTPAVNTANKILPDKLQLPTPSQIMGVATDMTEESPLKELTDEVTKQAASLAGEQIEQLKQSATDAFCSTIIERIKTECGLP